MKKINPQRLSRIIMSREVTKEVNTLLLMYSSLSSSQREEIKQILIKNRDK
jgi:hypothetical protein